MVEAGVLLSLVLEGCAQPSVKQPAAPSFSPSVPAATETTPVPITSELIGRVAYAIPAEDVPPDIEWKGIMSSDPTDVMWQDVKVELQQVTPDELDVRWFTNGTQVAVMPVWRLPQYPAGTWVLSDGFNGLKYDFTDGKVAETGFQCGGIIYLKLTGNGWQLGVQPTVTVCDAVPATK